MLSTSIPPKFPIPFANSAGGGFIRSIPTPSQIGGQPGAASLTDGFPPLNFIAIGAGGVPPFGQDFNGLLKQITQQSQWDQAGAIAAYDVNFALAVNGYPKGAVLEGTGVGTFWVSSVENNQTNPDAGAASFTASISGNTMTVSAISAGVVTLGQILVGAGLTANTVVTAFGTGTGGTGTYTVNNSQTITSEAMTATGAAGWAYVAGNAFWGGTTAGTANAQTCTIAPLPSQLPVPAFITLRAGLSNTGALTINPGVAGGGALPTKKNSSVGTVPLTGGEVIAGNIYEFVWDGAFLNLQGAAAASVSSGAGVAWGKTSIAVFNQSGISTTVLTAVVSGVVLSNAAGATILCASFSGNCNYQVNGLNGLDTGTFSSNPPTGGYYLHLVSDGLGNFALLGSVGVPNFPAGYSYYAVIGWCPVTTGPAFYKIYKTGNATQFSVTPATIVQLNNSANVQLIGGTSSLIPPEAEHCNLTFSSQAGNLIKVRLSTSSGVDYADLNSPAANTTFWLSAIVPPQNQNIFVGVLGADTVTVAVVGFLTPY